MNTIFLHLENILAQHLLELSCICCILGCNTYNENCNVFISKYNNSSMHIRIFTHMVKGGYEKLKIPQNVCKHGENNIVYRSFHKPPPLTWCQNLGLVFIYLLISDLWGESVSVPLYLHELWCLSCVVLVNNRNNNHDSNVVPHCSTKLAW